MKILKAGIPPESPALRANCHQCGCVAELTRKEGKYIYDPAVGDYIVTPCPTQDCSGELRAYAPREGPR